MMKKLVAILMVAGLFGATPLLAADKHEHGKMSQQSSIMECEKMSETLQDKIKKAKAEIEKGNKAYTDEELQALEQKLKEANDFLEAMGKN